MKLLYLSVHSILEYDELRMFEDLGIDYFSLGSYVTPSHPVDQIRPPLGHNPDQWLLEHCPPREKMPKEFIDKFDVIVVMHGNVPNHNWIIDNWEAMKGKRVIWRTIGQSTASIEKKMRPYVDQGLEIVRYSPKERNIENYAGENAIIRFSKSELEYNHWVGAGTEVITFAQNMKERNNFVNYEVFLKLIEGFDSRLYGVKNEASGALNGGYMSYAGMKEKMRDARVYVYTGTQPASYTLSFMEAMMTGIPIVAIGSKLWNSENVVGDVYEVPDIIQHGVNGYCSDDVAELRNCIQALVKDKRLAERIGNAGRETAIKLFGYENIKQDWKRYLQI